MNFLIGKKAAIIIMTDGEASDGAITGEWSTVSEVM